MRVMFFDTESTDLSASWGRILCASFISLTSDTPYTFRFDKKPFQGKTKVDDSKLVKAIKEELKKADMIVGWNSIMHDIPLLNARLALSGEDPITSYLHLDLMWYASGVSMKIGSRKLDNVAKFFKSPNQKTPLDGEIWQLAATGDVKAMDIVVDHCQHDVLVTKDMWPHLAPYVKKITLPLSNWWQYAADIRVNRI